jgi:RNA polymerase sigma factor FliA
MEGLRLLVVGERSDDALLARRALRELAIEGNVEACKTQEHAVHLLDTTPAHCQTLVLLDGRNKDVAKLTEDVRREEALRLARVFVLCPSGVVLEVRTSGTPRREFAAPEVDVYPLVDRLSELREPNSGKEAELAGAGRSEHVPQNLRRTAEAEEVELGDLIERVRNVARRVCRSMPQAIRADAEGAAMIGLMEALQHVNEMEPGHFEGYLLVRVRGAIKDELRRFDPLSRRARQMIRRAERAAAEYRASHGREPEIDQLAAMLGVEEDTCWSVLELSEYHSLPIDDETLASPSSTAEDRFIESYAATVLRWALGKLDKRGRLVLRLWYKRGLTIGTIAKRLNVSTARVHQLRVEAEHKLAAFFRMSPPMSELHGARVPLDWEERTYDTLKSGQAVAVPSLRPDPIRTKRGARGSS